jgi:ferredoxin--NADP+ reductase
VPGESLPGVHSARAFVNWYNGHPDFAQRQFDLSAEEVAVVGYARARPQQALTSSCINAHMREKAG